MSISKRKLISYQKQVGTKVRELRLSQSKTQLDLAVKCDMEKTAISRIENGRTNITLKTALLLSEELSIDVKDLFDFE